MNRGNDWKVSIMLAGGCAAAGAVLFRGFDPLALSILPLAAAAGLAAGTALLPLLAAGLICTAAVPASAPWICLASGLLASTAGRTSQVRAAGFITVVYVVWFIPSPGSYAVVAVSALCSFFPGLSRWSWGAAAAGFLLSGLLTGLPSNPGARPQVARSVIAGEGISYDLPSLDLSSREILIPAPVTGQWLMWLAADGGGVRDGNPMAAVIHREVLTVLSPGADTLCFTMAPGDTVTVRLLRKHHPFTHPVLHLSAGGERL